MKNKVPLECLDGEIVSDLDHGVYKSYMVEVLRNRNMYSCACGSYMTISIASKS